MKMFFSSIITTATLMMATRSVISEDYKIIRYQLTPPVLTYGKTVKIVFSLSPQPPCPRADFRMSQINLTGQYNEWTHQKDGVISSDDTTFIIPNGGFSQWGNYSAQCFSSTAGFFTYNPFPLSVAIPVNPRILKFNFSRLQDEFIPTTTTTKKPTDLDNVNATTMSPILPEIPDENGPTSFEYGVYLSNSITESWLLKFDVGNGYYPNAERGKFNLAGFDSLTKIASSSYTNQATYDVPYKNFPDGTSHRFVFDLNVETATSKAPGVCDFPLVASVAMLSDTMAISLHQYNVTLKLIYLPQQPSVTARRDNEDTICIVRCSIKSACPLPDSLKLQLETLSGRTLPNSVQTERNTAVEVRISRQDCDILVEMAKNNTGKLKCTAKNEVGTLTYELPLRDVPGIMSLERRKNLITEAAGLPFWAKVTIPVACFLVLVLFVLVIVLCVQKARIARRKKRHSKALAALAAANRDNNDNNNIQNQNQTLTMVVPPATTTANSNVPPVTRTPRLGDYRGPVSTRGQTYQMSQSETSGVAAYVESVDDDIDDEPAPRRPQDPIPRVLPPTPRSLDEVAFSYTSPPPRQPTSTLPPVVARPPAPPITNNRGNIWQEQPTMKPPPPPITTTTSSPQVGFAHPFNRNIPATATGIQREESYAKATRNAAARYLQPQSQSPSSSPAMTRKNAAVNSANNSSGSAGRTNSGGFVV